MNKDEFLLKLFEKSGIDTNFRFGRDEVIEEFELDEESFDNFASYWVNKGYLHGPNETTLGKHLTLFFNASGIDYAESIFEMKNKPDQKEIKESMSEERIKIFISHSSSDADLAKALVKLLISSLAIPKSQIRCTSVPGYKFDPGVDTKEAIRKEVNETEILIGLITPGSLQSSYVLFELGARWGINEYLIPVLANGADYKDLPSPIRDNNAVKLNKEGDLYDLIGLIGRQLGINTEKVSSYMDEIDSVIEHAVKKKNELNQQTVNKSAGSVNLNDSIKADAQKIQSKKKRKGILKSEKGVEIAQKAGEEFYSLLENACEENSHSSAGIVFNVERKHTSQFNWKGELSTNGGSALVEFYIPFTNSTFGFENNERSFEDAHIRVYAANYYLFDNYRRNEVEEKKTYERQYYFTVDESGTPGWCENKRGDDFVSTQAIINKIFLEFYKFSKQYRETY